VGVFDAGLQGLLHPLVLSLCLFLVFPLVFPLVFLLVFLRCCGAPGRRRH
jgi:hypothetical protein